MKWGVWTALVVAIFVAGGASAAEPTAEQQVEIKKIEALLSSLKPQFGDVQISEAKVTLHLGGLYYFLPAKDAKRVLTEGWGNPPETAKGVLGLVFPAGRTFLDDTWGAVVTYEQLGYVSDKDAKTADYDALLKSIQSGEAEVKQRREAGGFSSLHVVGWAQPPSYEPKNHTLTWAEEVEFGGQDVNTLSYDVRALGRHGVLSLDMIATMPDLPAVRSAAEGLRRTAVFEPGAAYEDFDPKVDQAAGYGVAGLIAAGAGAVAAKKLGLLAVLALFAKKGAILILAPLAAFFGRIKRFFVKPKPRATPTMLEDAEPAPDTSVAEAEADEALATRHPETSRPALRSSLEREA